jgi:hypothetical protein
MDPHGEGKCRLVRSQNVHRSTPCHPDSGLQAHVSESGVDVSDVVQASSHSDVGSESDDDEKDVKVKR